MKAIEVSGTIDEQHRLLLDAPLTVDGPSRVRVIILLDEEEGEDAWLRAAASNPAFDFLNDPAEDIYSLSDGKPLYDDSNDTSYPA